jgi:transcriptional regulator with XRE-family HTH domain
MNWAETIALLKRAGYGQAKVARICGCGQSTINELATGTTKSPRFELGLALLKLEAKAKRKLAMQAKAGEAA